MPISNMPPILEAFEGKRVNVVDEGHGHRARTLASPTPGDHCSPWMIYG
ncbi:hypothetical protein SLEP1_g48852 [Rubroshorea leprosula]|uniref:Uncharacterized protein n=1 Tax=Rubroshorea leprosula TaxID=152421 RepID=A0AAV5LWW9_9ROSI|nr:hypothetical protein SLEP1_g48852 [Rubroshorea leprosula]